MVVFLNNFNIRVAGRIAVVLLAIAVVGVATGCGRPNMKVVSAAATLPANEDSAAFLDRMSSLDTVGENDAMRSILLLLDEKDTAGSFEKRVKLLADRNIVPANWDFAAHRPITRGKFAYMIYQASKFPGGIILTLTGPSQRYCLRELQYHQVMASGALFAPVTGMELVGVLTRADEFIRNGNLPGEGTDEDVDEE